MRRFFMRCLLLCAAPFLPALAASQAAAQLLPRTFVSPSGSDSNSCVESAPCRTFQGAIGKTGANGVVACIDSGIFSAFSVTKAITVDCTGAVGLTTSGGVTVNAGPADIVTLRGLSITGFGGTIPGITFTSGAGLTLQNMFVDGYNGTNGLGIDFRPTTVATLDIVDSIISNNGNASTGGGLRVMAEAGGFARVSLRNVNVSKNFVGIAAVGSGPNSSVEIVGSTISHNRGIGLVAVGSGAVIRVGNSQIVGNAAAATSGNVLSYQNNQIVGNNPDTFPPSAGSLR